MPKKNSPKSNHKVTPTLTLPPRGGRKGEGDSHASCIAHHASRFTSHSSSFAPGAYYPAFFNLKGKKTVVIGGGKVAERKIFALLKTGANVTVISPEITKRIEKEKLKGRIKHIPRQYRKGDTKKTFLVIAATDSKEINKKVSEEATCLVNVVDCPSLCNFIVPSVIKRGFLTIAISTSGVSPALSKSIRKELERLYAREFARYLKLLEKIRGRTMKVIPDKKERTEFLKSLAAEKMIELLRQKGFKEVKKIISDTMQKFMSKVG
ncbi:MAG TPA: bifunctional precorrin-2 dehydrogenase/sirohydrochlorin ferrochelatase [Thermodesulfovibrionales bacterium]|nr:bifunctional precorrin-2 dehydrogenase/sirohydrochlorin ferrochelatase [Thermodesulfovibrionales bacterium]